MLIFERKNVSKMADESDEHETGWETVGRYMSSYILCGTARCKDGGRRGGEARAELVVSKHETESLARSRHGIRLM